MKDNSPIQPAWSRPLDRIAWTRDGRRGGTREIAEETPIALVYDASTYAVMMASPTDLEDFAVGFSLTEGIIDRLDDFSGIDIVFGPYGVEARMWLSPGLGARLANRRRILAGPTGCGLCGVDSLDQAARPWPPVADNDFRLSPEAVTEALRAMTDAQQLGAYTRAAHAAGFWRPDRGLVACREDVGRHNALDKLIGALSRAGEPATDGAVVLTSRVSIEMVQKTARLGAPVLIAVSAPTALAVETAKAAEITLIAVAREDGFEVFSRPDRLSWTKGP